MPRENNVADRMRAVIINAYGAADVLHLAEVPTPVAASGEALIRIRAAAVNPADPKWRSGMLHEMMPIQFPHILGYDVAGEIVQSTRFAPGTRVVAMVDPITKGGYAEFATVQETALAQLPEGLSFEAAAAIPTASLTGLQAVDEAINVQRSERLLISGATGAVGRAAIWAALERGAAVVAAVRPSQRTAAMALGVGEVIDLPLDAVDLPPFDHLFDTVGGADAAQLGRHLPSAGKFITVATTPIPTDDLPVLPQMLFVRPDGPQLERLAAAVDRGELALPPLEIIGFDQLADAHRVVEAGGGARKYILAP